MKVKNTKKSIAIKTLLGLAVLQLNSPAFASDTGNTSASCSDFSLTNNVLTISGTSFDDEITAYTSGGSLYVDHYNSGSNTTNICGPYASVAKVTATLNSGNDYFDGSALSIPLTVYGGRGNDDIYGGSGADTLIGDDGEDTISGGNGNDVITGGNDGDLLVGCKGADQIDGGSGNDFIGGGSAIENPNGADLYVPVNCSSSDGDSGDTLAGGDGNDFISGGSGEDKISGGSGHDALTGNGGQEDRISGSSGDDLIVEEGDGDPDRTDWFKAEGNSGDDFLIANNIRAYLTGGGGNDAIMTVSSNMNAKLYGGDNGDFIATEDGAPEGSCGSGDDKGHVFLNSCENTSWANDGYEELLKKLDRKSSYDNPYFTLFNAFMNSEYLDDHDWMYYDRNEEPEIIYNFPSRHTFKKWNENRTRNIYDYYSVSSILQGVPLGNVTAMYSSLWCYVEGEFWQCGSLLGPNFECYEKGADNNLVLAYSTALSTYDDIEPEQVCEATTFSYYEKGEYDFDLGGSFDDL